MRPLTAFNIAVGIGAAIFFASLAPPAYAMDNGNPWLPTITQSDGAKPMKISDPAYCSKEITHSCVGLDLLNGDGVQPTIHYTPKAAPAPAPKP